MTRTWMPRRGLFGAVLQSSMPTRQNPSNAGRANGLTVRGVVVAVYAYDSEEPVSASEEDGLAINSIYVSVLCYGKVFNGVLPRVLWTHDRSGLHDGDVSLPRPTTIDITGDFDPNSGSNVANLDGDHVIIGFLDDDLAQPYVLRCIPHPSSDIGNSARATGHRMRLKKEDKTPRLWKHQGSIFGLDMNGNWLVDLRRAHTGEYEPDGQEPAPGLSGDVGNVQIFLPEGSRYKIGITKGAQEATSHDPDPDTNTTSLEIENNKITMKIDGGTPQNLILEGGNFTLENAEDTTLNTDGKVHLGTGANHPVIHGDTYQSDMNTMNPQVKLAWDQLFTLFQLAFTTLNPFILVPPPLEPAFAAYAAAMGPGYIAAMTIMQSAGLAVQTFDSATAGQLSTDVDAK